VLVLQLADCLVLLPRLEVEILSKASRRLETNFYVVMAPLKILLVGPKEAGKSTVRCCLRSLARLR
jgi:polynucleotide 5'-kinase involved in rRNA processing